MKIVDIYALARANASESWVIRSSIPLQESHTTKSLAIRLLPTCALEGDLHAAC